MKRYIASITIKITKGIEGINQIEKNQPKNIMRKAIYGTIKALRTLNPIFSIFIDIVL